jgi:cell division protein FtsL
MKPIVVVLIACGLCAALLVGWAIAWYWDRSARIRDAEEMEQWKRADEEWRRAGPTQTSGDSPTPD